MDEENEPRVVHAPIDRLGAVGLWIRRQLLAKILQGTPVLVLIQKHRTPMLTKVMKLFTLFGTEDFYCLLVVSFLWILDARLGRLLGLLMAMAFYLGGAVKNFLMLPRPPSPPIVPLKKDTDWGLPSHHTLLGVNMPWYIWFYMYQNYQLELPVAVVLFLMLATWSFCVMFSRLYLGVHSPADVVAGGVLGCLLLSFWLQVDNVVDFYMTSVNISYVILVGVIVLMLIHPDSYPLTITYDDTMALAGITAGFAFGRAFAKHRVMYAILDKHTISSLGLTKFFCFSGVRLVLGLCIYLLLKTILYHGTSFLITGVCQLWGISTVCIKRRLLITKNTSHYNSNFRLPDQKDTTKKSLSFWESLGVFYENKPVNIDFVVKFVTYTGIGWLAIHWLPALYCHLGI